MPPTFLLFLGLVLYIPVLGIAFIIGGPMLLSEKWRNTGKTIILTAAVSLPIFLMAGLILALLLALPGIAVILLLKKIALLHLTGLLLFLILLLVVAVGFYHWFLSYLLIRNYLQGRPLESGLENNVVYRLLLKRIADYTKHYLQR